MSARFKAHLAPASGWSVHYKIHYKDRYEFSTDDYLAVLCFLNHRRENFDNEDEPPTCMPEYRDSPEYEADCWRRILAGINDPIYL